MITLVFPILNFCYSKTRAYPKVSCLSGQVPLARGSA